MKAAIKEFLPNENIANMIYQDAQFLSFFVNHTSFLQMDEGIDSVNFLMVEPEKILRREIRQIQDENWLINYDSEILSIDYDRRILHMSCQHPSPSIISEDERFQFEIDDEFKRLRLVFWDNQIKSIANFHKVSNQELADIIQERKISKIQNWQCLNLRPLNM